MEPTKNSPVGKVVEEQKKLIEYFEKPEVKEMVLNHVAQFHFMFKTAWFSMKDLRKIAKDAPQKQLEDVIATLELCGFLAKKERGDGVIIYRLSANRVKRDLNVATE